jgi:nucleotide-binding universal stress UspA family protein
LYSHILVGLDQSGAAHRALLKAMHLATKFKATLTAVAVAPTLSPYSVFAAALGPEPLQIMESDQRALFAGLLEVARREGAQHAIEIETVLSCGSVVISICEAMRKNQADLLVLGIHPGKDLLGWLSRGTAHELALRATCDVLGVH